MNLILKRALKIAIPAVAISLSSSGAYADCSATFANPAYHPHKNTLQIPLVKVLDESTDQSNFVAGELRLVAGTGLFAFATSNLKSLGDNCKSINPTASYDERSGKLDVPILQVFAPKMGDAVSYYHAGFQWDEEQGIFKLAQIDEPQFAGIYGTGKHHFALATGSPGELGLLKVLAETFAEKEQATMYWRKAGSGSSLNLLKDQAVDMAMVHAIAAEKQAVADGWASHRSLIGSNEFYIVGPVSDPANIAEAESAQEAYTRIANAQATFLSRGDNSGTHKRELSIWESANISPAGDWYLITNDFMMATLIQANEESGYFMTDSSTWVAGRKGLSNLALLFRGDPVLVNVYHALTAPDNATPGQPWAKKFVEFVGSEQGQQIIADYGQSEYGESLYNDMAYAQQYDH